MNTPIGYPLAKLLKEKGFDVPCREGWVNYLVSFTGETRMPDDESNLVIDKLGNRHLIERPTIADVVMWLYEKHGIWLYCEIKGDNFYVKAKRIKSNWRRVVSGVVNNENILFNSPIEAYEAGIKYCLEKVI
jgi:hypothetical protein